MAQPDETSTGESDPIKKFRGQGWYNVWGVLLAIFAGLLCACLYWIVQIGIGGAFDSTQFGFELFFAALIGIVLMGRWTVPYLLQGTSDMDPRSVNLMRSPRSGWFLRRFRNKQ